jgi:hypothetical protein
MFVIIFQQNATEEAYARDERGLEMSLVFGKLLYAFIALFFVREVSKLFKQVRHYLTFERLLLNSSMDASHLLLNCSCHEVQFNYLRN